MNFDDLTIGFKNALGAASRFSPLQPSSYARLRCWRLARHPHSKARTLRQMLHKEAKWSWASPGGPTWSPNRSKQRASHSRRRAYATWCSTRRCRLTSATTVRTSSWKGWRKPER